MDITVQSSNSVELGIAKNTPNIVVENNAAVQFDVSKKEINLSVRKSSSPAFEFVQRVISGANVVRCTLAEFEAMTSYDGKTFYAVTTTSDELRYLYLGPTLVAKAEVDGGVWGFAYTFPITFGR